MPITLWDSLGKVLSGVIEFVMPSNQKWCISYERSCSSFISLKEFATFYGLEKNYIVTLEYLGYSCFFVRIFDKSSLEISYLKLCKPVKRYDILLKSEYQFGFFKRNVIDVSRSRDIIGNSQSNFKYSLMYFVIELSLNFCCYFQGLLWTMKKWWISTTTVTYFHHCYGNNIVLVDLSLY